jgi:predicted nucleic acid-binding protein
LKVVDASVVVEALVDATPLGGAARRLLAGPLAAPDHIDLEVTNALRNLERGRVVSEAAAQAFLRALAALPIARRRLVPLLDRVWELRHNATPYDASYVALAEALDAPLVTADSRLLAVPGRRCRVELLVAP